VYEIFIKGFASFLESFSDVSEKELNTLQLFRNDQFCSENGQWLTAILNSIFVCKNGVKSIEKMY